jgi:hypothetical protein
MFRQVGAAYGVAAFVVASPTREQAIDAYRRGWAFMAAAATIGGLLMLAARLVSATVRAGSGGTLAPSNRQEARTSADRTRVDPGR